MERCHHEWDVVEVFAPKGAEDSAPLGEWRIRYACLKCDVLLDDTFCVFDPLLAHELALSL